MAGIGSGVPLFLAGCVASCGALLVVAGSSKLYRAARQVPDASAVRRALGMTRRRWRPVEAAAGALECAIGLIVCAGVYPALGGAAMAAAGAGFCGLLGYARARRVTGGCGCIQWRAAPTPAEEAVSAREMARAALVAAAGVAGAVFLRGEAGAFGRPWFWAGILVGGALLVLLSTRRLPRTPVCRRPLWFPARATLRALAGNAVFEAVAESAGPAAELSAVAEGVLVVDGASVADGLLPATGALSGAGVLPQAASASPQANTATLTANDLMTPPSGTRLP